MERELFHYTKVDTLELILMSKRIRFSSLSEVDDLEEQFTDDLYDYGKHVFVACFTDDKKESIPIWNMYSKGGQGVRLGFRGNLFDKFTHLNDGEGYKLIVACSGKAFPIEYTDEEDKLYPRVEKEINGIIGHNTSVLGIYKGTQWSFQKEWRYSLLVYKGNIINNQMMVDVRNIPISYYDVKVKEDIFNKLEITLGYNIDNFDRDKVRLWVKDFNYNSNSNITVRESCLLHKVR